MLITLALFAILFVVVLFSADKSTDDRGTEAMVTLDDDHHSGPPIDTAEPLRTAQTDWHTVNIDGTPMVAGTMMDVDGKIYGEAGTLSDIHAAHDTFNADAFSSPSSTSSGSDW